MSGAVLVEWFDEHHYRVTENGETKLIPSVTTKLSVLDKPNLRRWYGDLGSREAELRKYEASQKGVRIHWAYATALKGGAVVYDPWQRPVYTPEGIQKLHETYPDVAVLRTQEEMWAITKLAEQFRRLNPEVLGVEETVHDFAQNDAGTIDNILLVKDGSYSIAGPKALRLSGGIYVNDLKTGSYVGDDVWLQLAPYTIMYEKMHNVTCRGALVTHTGSTIKGGIAGLKTSFCPRESLDIYYQKYRNIAKVWEDKHEGDQPKTYEFPSLITMKTIKEEAA